MSNLESLSVQVVVSDPWDFATEHGTGPFAAQIVKVHAKDSDLDSAILQFIPPFTEEGEEHTYFIAQARHENQSLKMLVQGKNVHCNFVRIPASQVNSEKPFDLSWWRGGLTLTGTLKLLDSV